MSNTKYKIEEVTGCTAFDIRVNDKSISELSKEEHEQMLDYLFLKAREGLNDQTIVFEQILHLFQYDGYEHDPNQCESCGDYTSSTTWNI
jgi:hypothetical protein